VWPIHWEPRCTQVAVAAATATTTNDKDNKNNAANTNVMPMLAVLSSKRLLIFLNSLFYPDSIHDLLENSAMNFLTSYTLFYLNSLIKTQSSAENTVLLLFNNNNKIVYTIVYVDCINKRHFWSAAAVCNAILVMEIFCYWYSTNYNSAKKWFFSTKFGISFSSLLGIKRTKLYWNSFRFDIVIVQCLGVYFFTGHSIFGN